jgi:hypothetical protein
MSHEHSLSGKWLELLKQIAPGVDAALSTGPAQFGVIQAVALTLRVEASPINTRNSRACTTRD